MACTACKGIYYNSVIFLERSQEVKEMSDCKCKICKCSPCKC